METRHIFLRQYLVLIAILSIFFCIPSGAFGTALTEGTVINSENLDQLLKCSFEGKALDQLIPEKLQWMIQNKGFTMTLHHSSAVPVDPRWEKATREFSGQVKLDPKTRKISGYTAGIPFPEISPEDPHVADKLIWNLYLRGGYPRHDFQLIPQFCYLLVDGDKGQERSMVWYFSRVWMMGRLDEKHILGDGSIYYKQMIMGVEPLESRGMGTFRIRFSDGRPDEAWAQARSAHRPLHVSKLSGADWIETIGGTDQLNDEVSIFSAYPTWYPKYKLLQKRYILAVAHSRWPTWTPDNPSNSYPTLNANHVPYWNSVNDWEPREVYVVEASMPEGHPYSRRVYYFDAKTWVPYLAECYDYQGEFVKLMINETKPIKGSDADNSWGVEAVLGSIIDLKKNHATIFFHGKNYRNPSGMGEKDVSLSVMEEILKGRLRTP